MGERRERYERDKKKKKQEKERKTQESNERSFLGEKKILLPLRTITEIKKKDFELLKFKSVPILYLSLLIMVVEEKKPPSLILFYVLFSLILLLEVATFIITIFIRTDDNVNDNIQFYYLIALILQCLAVLLMVIGSIMLFLGYGKKIRFLLGAIFVVSFLLCVTVAVLINYFRPESGQLSFTISFSWTNTILTWIIACLSFFLLFDFFVVTQKDESPSYYYQKRYNPIEDTWGARSSSYIDLSSSNEDEDEDSEYEDPPVSISEDSYDGGKGKNKVYDESDLAAKKFTELLLTSSR